MRLNSKRRFVLKILLPVGGVFLAAVFFLAFVYRATPGNGLAIFLARMFRFPALRVNGETVTLDEYYRYDRALKQWYGFDDQSEFAADSTSDGLMERLTVIALERDMAVRRGIRLEQKEVKDLAVRLGGQGPDLEVILRDRYHWTEKDFRELIVEPLALEQKLRAEIPDFEIVLERERRDAKVRKYLE
ncbi:MAG: hypothetical protein AAB444_02640 [Patescibacteria group bacterium]